MHEAALSASSCQVVTADVYPSLIFLRLPDRRLAPAAEALAGKAQRNFAKAHDSAAEQYGGEERADRVACNAVKHQYQKVGDHWEPRGHKGSSECPSARNDLAGG